MARPRGAFKLWRRNALVQRADARAMPPARWLFPTLWLIDKNSLANNAVHCLPVDVGPNHFEFELVISGQRVAGLHRQQLGPLCVPKTLFELMS